jgi:hypothetical protein
VGRRARVFALEAQSKSGACDAWLRTQSGSWLCQEEVQQQSQPDPGLVRDDKSSDAQLVTELMRMMQPEESVIQVGW